MGYFIVEAMRVLVVRRRLASTTAERVRALLRVAANLKHQIVVFSERPLKSLPSNLR